MTHPKQQIPHWLLAVIILLVITVIYLFVDNYQINKASLRETHVESFYDMTYSEKEALKEEYGAVEWMRLAMDAHRRKYD